MKSGIARQSQYLKGPLLKPTSVFSLGVAKQLIKKATGVARSSKFLVTLKYLY